MYCNSKLPACGISQISCNSLFFPGDVTDAHEDHRSTSARLLKAVSSARDESQSFVDSCQEAERDAFAERERAFRQRSDEAAGQMEALRGITRVR